MSDSGKGRRRYIRSGKESLSDIEVDALLGVISHLEDEALLALAITTGIRREDVVSIKLSEVNLADYPGRIRYYEAKKRRTRTVPLSGGTHQRLRQHVSKLPRGTPWLFPSPRNPKNHLSGRTAYNILNRWLKAAGLRSRPFHALRSTCIKLAKKRGWSPEQVMDLTGDTWRTIQIHYATPTEEEMATVAEERPIL